MWWGMVYTLDGSPGVSCTHSGEKCGGRGTAGEEAGIFPNALELADG